MTLFALMILLASGQTSGSGPGAEASQEVYSRPAISPYEPPSDFGRQLAEGDAEARPRRAGGAASVEDREDARLAADVRYREAVQRRYRAAQALMGPLDGLWSVVDHDGKELLTLAMVDRGDGHALEGAWSAHARGEAARSGSVAVGEAEAGTVRDLRLLLDGGARSPILHQDADGVWIGELAGEGRFGLSRSLPIRLAPQT